MQTDILTSFSISSPMSCVHLSLTDFCDGMLWNSTLPQTECKSNRKSVQVNSWQKWYLLPERHFFWIASSKIGSENWFHKLHVWTVIEIEQ